MNGLLEILRPEILVQKTLIIVAMQDCIWAGQAIRQSKKLRYMYMFLAFFWGIYLSCSSKFEILTLFCLKIFIFDFRHLAACSGKNMLHRGLFGVSMES